MEMRSRSECFGIRHCVYLHTFGLNTCLLATAETIMETAPKKLLNQEMKNRCIKDPTGDYYRFPILCSGSSCLFSCGQTTFCTKGKGLGHGHRAACSSVV